MTRTAKSTSKPALEAPAPAAKRQAPKPKVDAAPIAVTPPAAPAEVSSAPTVASRPSGKLGLLIDLLEREGGANLEEMVQATGWQTHSVRGAMSGALKKKRKLTVLSEKTDQGRRYRIATEEAVR